MLFAFALSTTFLWMLATIVLACLVVGYGLYRIDYKIERRREVVGDLGDYLSAHFLDIAAKPLKKYRIGDYDGVFDACAEAVSKLDTEPERKAHFQAVALKLINKLMTEDENYAQKVLEEAQKFAIVLRNQREAEAEKKTLEDQLAVEKAKQIVATAGATS